MVTAACLSLSLFKHLNRKGNSWGKYRETVTLPGKKPLESHVYLTRDNHDLTVTHPQSQKVEVFLGVILVDEGTRANCNLEGQAGKLKRSAFHFRAVANCL